MRGKLFTRDFLDVGIEETRAWRSIDEGELDRFQAIFRSIFETFPVAAQPNEATTERDLIEPVLRALGWQSLLPQQTTSGHGRRDVPDYLLFADPHAKGTAQEETREADRYRHGLTILEAKRWQRPLDRGDVADPLDDGAPSTQMLRYLSRAEVASEGRIRWGVLTNGRHWRLYWQGARSRLEEFLELDLAALAGIPGFQPDLDSPEAAEPDRLLRAFVLLFRPEAFLPDPGDPAGHTFHEIAQAESRLWEERVSSDLGDLVFEQVFPELLASLIRHDPQAPKEVTADYLEEVRRGGLTLLYQLLFVLYAEDRNLLPAHDREYDDYSLRKVRLEIADRTDRADAFASRAARIHGHLADLFNAIGTGDPNIGLPAYDGGLFDLGEWCLLLRRVSPESARAWENAVTSNGQRGGAA